MRNIYIVNATQVVVSEAHPEGVFSVLPDYPKYFDSRNYPAVDGDPNGDDEKALRIAKAEYLSRQSAFYASDSRAMATVTLERANGSQIWHDSIGAFPNMMPEPEPEEPTEEVQE